MQPRAEFGMQQAVVSMLAGGMFDQSRKRLPLALVKAAYYLKSAGMLSRAWIAHRRRRHNAGIELQIGQTTAEEG